MSRSGIVCRSIVAQEFRTIPLRTYYIDMPGAGMAGSNITGTGTDESIQAVKVFNDSSVWRRDMYSWFDAPLKKEAGREVHIIIGWDSMTFSAAAPSSSGGGVSGTVHTKGILEDYSASFAHDNLPSLSPFESTYLLALANDDGGSSSTTFEAGVVFPQIHSNLKYIQNVDIYGIRLRIEMSPIDIYPRSLSLGEFKTGDPDYDAWQWPDDVWCWLWERGQ